MTLFLVSVKAQNNESSMERHGGLLLFITRFGTKVSHF